MTALAKDALGGQIQVVGFGAVDNVSFSGTAADSENFPVGTSVVMLVPTESCWVKEVSDTTDVTATTGSKLVGGLPMFLRVTPGNHLSVLQVESAGDLNITYCV